ncbi:hypothetical protein QN277_019134 [Acacia crassicarpa]|uniref:Uncharacterized protein n=1 Tax=Acacia crassicarpa TaxID=499986 RepID=A0AAE1KKF7_9FABA|nr:hypothetical protein QN277_019134 [Acacia crassicarpa]
MDKEWSESRYEPRDRDDQEDSPLREQYDDSEQVGTDKSSKHRSKDRKNSSRGEDKEHRSKDRDKQKRTMEDVSKEREKEARDIEKDRMGSWETKREDRDEREKERSKDSKLKEKDYDREKHRDKDRERDKDKKERGKDKDREKEREMEKETERGWEKQRGKEKARDRDRDREKEKERDKAKERERERHRDHEKDRESYRDGDKDKVKDKVRDKEREADQDKERSRDRVTRKTLEDDDFKADIHDKRDEDIGKLGKASNLDGGEQNGETSAHPSETELGERILKMKEARLTKQSEGASEILSWVSRSRKIEEKKNAEKEKALQLSKIFEEQDKIALEESEDEGATQHTTGKVLTPFSQKELSLGSLLIHKLSYCNLQYAFLNSNFLVECEEKVLETLVVTNCAFILIVTLEVDIKFRT